VRSGARLRLRSGVEHGARLHSSAEGEVMAKAKTTRSPQMTEIPAAKTFVGMDAHDRQCTICALDTSGTVIWEGVVPTEKLKLRRAIKALPAPTWLLMESSTNAFFITECMEDIAARVVVAETRHNRLISSSDSKTDQLDALRLAKLLRMGEFKEVHVPARPRQELREVLSTYQRAVVDVVRAKSRVKRAFRRYGVAVSGDAVYNPEQRSDWLGKVSPTVAFAINVQFDLMDAALKAQDSLARKLSSMLSKTKDYKLLKEIPGVGPIIAAIFVAVIDTPHRFDTKRKLWSYAGLGVRVRWSSDPGKAHHGGSRTGNRLLKYAAMMASKSASIGNNRFAEHYSKMIADGSPMPMARKTIARSILATAWSMWKAGSAYRADHQAKA
jgi:transposase